MKTPLPIASWVLLCTFLTCAGWILSALQALHVAGYGAAFAVAATGIFRLGKAGVWAAFAWPRLPARRFRGALPAAFALLAVLIFIGGALYAPNIYDALAYRTPRVLAWIAEGRWHWIHTAFPRLNTRSCGFEWLTVPIVLFTKSDRLFFLINFVSFLLLPGLIFSTLTRLGIASRVARHWMWPLAAGYCFSLEAGGIQNDLFSAPWALAMIDFALRARRSGRLGEVWLSVLAAALLTGSKTSALPLLLPWALALLPSAHLQWRRPLASLLVAAAAAVSSFLPTAMLNAVHTDDWTGQRIESIYQGKHAGERLIMNSAVVAIHNLLPPIFPWTRQWDALVGRLGPLNDNQRMSLAAPEMAPENSPGLGFGVCALLAVSLVAALRKGRPPAVRRRRSWLDWAILLAPVGAALVLAASAFIVGSGARYFTPYYVLLVAPLLIFRGHARVVGRGWWRLGALASILLAAGLNVITPAHPLLPFSKIFPWLETRVSHPLVARAAAVYTVFAERPDAFAPIRAALPPGTASIGLITWDDPETSLWRPFGRRRVRHVLPADTAAGLRAQGIEFIVVSLEKFPHVFGPDQSFDRWLREIGGEPWRRIPLRLRAGRLPAGFHDWIIVRLAPDLPPKPPLDP